MVDLQCLIRGAVHEVVGRDKQGGNVEYYLDYLFYLYRGTDTCTITKEWHVVRIGQGVVVKR